MSHSGATLHCPVMYSTLLCTSLHGYINYPVVNFTLLYFIALYCTYLQCTVLHCIVLYFTAQPCKILQCTALTCPTLHCNTLNSRGDMQIKVVFFEVFFLLFSFKQQIWLFCFWFLYIGDSKFIGQAKLKFISRLLYNK